MAQTNRDNRTSKTNDDIRQWPWQAQFAALLFALVVAAFLIVLPVLVVRVLDTEYAFSSETDLWAAMIAILLGLTTMTVSGIFVFMTFRIDRGARLEAQKTAQKEATKAMKQYGERVVDKLGNLTKAVENHFGDSKQKIDDLYSSVKEDVSAVAEKTKEEVSKFADTVKTDVSQAAATVKTDVSQAADKSMKAVEEQVEKSNQSIQKKFDDGMLELRTLFETARKKAQEAIDDDGETPDDDGDEGSNRD